MITIIFNDKDGKGPKSVTSDRFVVSVLNASLAMDMPAFEQSASTSYTRTEYISGVSFDQYAQMLTQACEKQLHPVLDLRPLQKTALRNDAPAA